jgi:acyl-CoA synthetase (AMP-forming)/AMP-acid ligase II
VWAPNSVEWLELEYGSALAGTVLVPLNPALLDHEVDHALRGCGAVRVYTVAESRGKPLLERAQALARELPAVREIVDLRVPVPAAASTSAPKVRPSDPFLVQYTSGTTARPKGAVLSHAAAYNAARMYGACFSIAGRSATSLPHRCPSTTSPARSRACSARWRCAARSSCCRTPICTASRRPRFVAE